MRESCPESFFKGYVRAAAYALGYIGEVTRAINAAFPNLQLNEAQSQELVHELLAAAPIPKGLNDRETVRHQVERIVALVDEVRGLSPGYAKMVSDLSIDPRVAGLVAAAEAWPDGPKAPGKAKQRAKTKPRR